MQKTIVGYIYSVNLSRYNKKVNILQEVFILKKLSLVLCVVLILSVFVGCGGDSKKEGSSQSGTSDGIFSTAAVNYAADGEAVYAIVRPDNGTQTEIDMALLLFKQYRDAHAVKAKNISDSQDGTDNYEILIGNTNRPETAQACDWLAQNINKRSDNYIICTIGKKIVIYGNSDNALNNAVDHFVKNFLSATQSKGIKYTYAAEGDFIDLNVNGVSIGEYSIVRPHYNSSYLTYAEVEKMVDKIYNTTGYKLAINDDTITNEAKYEIIIGDCARPNVTKIDARDEYSVKVSGDKIYINGGSHQATTVAVTELIKKLDGKTALTDADSFDGSYQLTVANYDTATYYTPKFYDDFDDISGDNVNANGLDTNKWHLNTENGKGKNGYKATRSTDPSRVYVADGMFQIHPYFDYETNTYYGGFLETGKTMKMTYGYIEYSAKIPDGPGFWTALWLRCNDYSGSSRPEIDIAESFGNSKTFAFNLHTWPGNDAEELGITHTSLDGNKKYSAKKKECPDGKRFGDDFHTYGMLWTPEVAWATCDGVPYFKYTMGDKETDSWCFGKLMKICISEAVGFESNSGDPLDASEEVWENNAVYLVDWVYVYQLEDGIQKMELYK